MKAKIPGADGKIAFDKFHVASHLGRAVNDVRLQEHRTLTAQGDKTLKGTKHVWLQNPKNMKPERWTEFAALRPLVPRTALDTPWQRGTLRDLMREALAIARDGLRARARPDAAGRDETIHLGPLEAIAAGGPTQAERWLERYHGPWRGDVSHILREAAI